MSFGSTIVLTVNSVTKTLNRINNDNYGSEYLLRNATEEYRMKIRHSKEAAKAGQEAFERHNVDVTQTVFATDTTPELVRNMYFIMRVRASDAASAGTGYLADAIVNYLDSATVQGDVLSWQN